jgi:hypothetical protein
MSLVSFSRVADGRPLRSAARIMRPRVERLEDRCTPVVLISPASLVSVANDGLHGADAPVDVLGTSDDGNFLLVQSTATNLVSGQVDVPGTTDLFWYDRTTGTVKLVSRRDPALTNGSLATTLGVEPSTPGVKLNAVISGDGKSVAFLSGANAQQFNAGLPPATDDGGLDCFQWNSADDTVRLVSTDKNGFALGSFSAVSNPAISRDGKTVAFVSTAQLFSNFNNKFKAGEDNGAVDPGRPGPNVFAALALVDTTTNQLKGSTFDIPRPVTYQFCNVNSLTGKQGTFFPDMGDVSVDPLGRYMSAEGLSFAVIDSNLITDGFVRPCDVGSISGSLPDVTRFSFAGVGLNPPGSLIINSITVTTDGFLMGADNLGAAGNAIIARDRGDVILFTAKTVTGTGFGSLVPGYVNQNGGGFDLYRAEFSGGSGRLDGYTSQLISVSAAGNNAGANGSLDVTPGAYNITPDGRHVVFTSTGTNLVNGLIDKNKAADIFQRDVQNQTTVCISVTSVNPNRTGLGASTFPVQTTDGLVVGFQSTASDLSNTPDSNGVSDIYVRNLVRHNTALASIVPGNFNSGNGKSFAPVIGGGFLNGRIYYSSEATDLDRAFPDLPANTAQVYTDSTPILATGVPRQLAFSGGSNGFVGIGHLDLDGNIITDNKFQPFPGYTGDIRVASADVNGDGVLDLIAGAGPGGGPRVVVIDGFNGRTIRDFFAFEPSFTGGVYVAGADFNNDGFADVIVGAGEGGAPRVVVFDGANGGRMVDDFAYEASARTGVRVAGGDFNGDGTNDLVVAAGVGGGPRVRVFDGTKLPSFSVLADFFAYESTQRGGAYVNIGDFNGDGKADIITGAGPDGGPRVRVFNAANLITQNPNIPFTFLDFFAFNSNSRDGVRVAFRDIDGDNTADIVVGSGAGNPVIKTYAGGVSGGDGAPLLLQTIDPFDEIFGQFGAWVG